MYKKIILIISLILNLAYYPALANVNEKAESFISQLLERKIPYQKQILNCKFIIEDKNAYSPGLLQAMFLEYLIEKDLVKDKLIADIGSACGSLGITLVKNGANKALITNLYTEAAQCAINNAKLNEVEANVNIYLDSGITPLLPKYKNKVDFIVTGLPWDSISLKEFNKIKPERKQISKAFYDIDDQYINELLLLGDEILKPKGKIYITACKRILDKIHNFCSRYGYNYTIVKEQDLHDDGDTNYILELKKN